MKHLFKHHKFVLVLFALFSVAAFAQPDPKVNEKIEAIYGTRENSNFSFHNPTYFIFGDDDHKLQFSLKYRLSNPIPLYFAYSQLMFWKIYEESKPFADVNYRPEFFYRLIDRESNAFKTLDFGHLHASNGQDGLDSRSLDKLFLRGNYITKIRRHFINVNLMLYQIFDEDSTNKDIQKHLGYWDLTMVLTDALILGGEGVDLEFRTYAGEKGYDFDQGATQVGLVYNFDSKILNPSFYLQRFEGYGESLMTYNKRRTEYRLGFMLSF